MLIDAEHAGALLLELRDTGRTIPELPDGLRPATWEEAYAIQDALHAAGGWEIGALKVGCTSEAAQRALGIDEPIAGRVPASAVHPSGATLDHAAFHHQPQLECEVAFRLGHDVTAAVDIGSDAAVRAAVDAVAGAIEVADTRYDDPFGASGTSLVADNSGAAALVLGEPRALEGIDAAALGVALRCGDTELARGSAAAVLGDPFRSLRWLLAHERSRGRDVAAGTWVITGTCTGLTPCPRDEPVTAVFDALGQVELVLA